MTAALLPVACGGDLRTLEVEHYQLVCEEEATYLCPVTRASDADPWQRFFDPIRGYEHDWGRRRTIEVRETRAFSSSASDAVTVTLERIIDDQPVDPDTPFTFAFDPLALDVEAPLVRSTSAGGVFSDGQTFTCADAPTCADLDASFVTNGTVVLDLRVTDPSTPALELWRVSLQ